MLDMEPTGLPEALTVAYSHTATTFVTIFPQEGWVHGMPDGIGFRPPVGWARYPWHRVPRAAISGDMKVRARFVVRAAVGLHRYVFEESA